MNEMAKLRQAEIDRLTAEKEMLRTALTRMMEQAKWEDDMTIFTEAYKNAEQSLALTASKESDIERDVRTAGQG